MKDVGVGFPLQKHYGFRFILMFIFAPALFMLSACTDEKPGEPMAPKVIVRMKAPPIPEPQPRETIETESVSPPHEPDASTGQRESDTGPAPAHDPGEGSAATATPENTSEKDGANIAVPAPAVENEKAESPDPTGDPDRAKAEPQDGLYRVKPGDTLASISARDDVYGSILKWPCLFRINMDKLNHLGVSENLPERALPEGAVLAYVTHEQAAINVAQLGSETWVVNVLSSKKPGRIVPAALRLMKGGFRVYIVRAEVKGDYWMRLRAGFFSDAAQARAAGEKITQIVTTGKPWVAKVGGTELQEFGGY